MKSVLIYDLQVVGVIVVVLSSVLSNDPGCSNPLLSYSNEPVNIVGLNDRLPIVLFLALSVVQIAVIVSGNENQIMVRIISTLLFWCTNRLSVFKGFLFFDPLNVYFRPAQSLRLDYFFTWHTERHC